MENRLEDSNYDPNESPKLCIQVAAEIRKRILKLGYERYAHFFLDYQFYD